MKTYRLFTDSTADLSGAYYRAHDVTVLPYTYIVDDTVYSDDPFQPMDLHTFYQAMREGSMPTTTNINQATIAKAVTPCFEAGEDVVYIVFSSGLTSTYQFALATKTMLEEQYPERKLYVVDSVSASIGQGVLVKHAVDMRDRGLSAQELVDDLNAFKLKINHWITVADLDHLRRGGRISATTATFGKMLNIKPIINVDNQGRLVNVEKVNGRKKSVRYLVKRVQEIGIDLLQQQPLHIVHGDCVEEAERFAALVKAATGVEQIEISYLGPVIGSHTGPDMLAIVFLGEHR